MAGLYVKTEYISTSIYSTLMMFNKVFLKEYIYAYALSAFSQDGQEQIATKESSEYKNEPC